METQLGTKGYTLDVFIDIEGVFDSISNKSIKEAMTKARSLRRSWIGHRICWQIEI